MSEQNVNTLVAQLNKAREDSASDSQREETAKSLQAQLGTPGKPAADIIRELGNPELTPTLNGGATIQTMPGLAVPADVSTTGQNQQEQPPYYFKYNLGPKNYVYFKIDSTKETVIDSGYV